MGFIAAEQVSLILVHIFRNFYTQLLVTVTVASQDQKIMPMLVPEDILVTLCSDGPASVCSQQLGKHFSRDMPCVNVFPSILNPANK